MDKNDLNKRMDGAVKALMHDLSGLRTGRASTNMLDTVIVEAYGDKMPLNQVANITIQDAKLLIVQVWDKELTKAVEKAISLADLGVTASAEGQTIRVSVPPLSEERRKDLVKVAHKYAENAKVAVRNIRRDGVDHLKKQEKEKEISEDELRKLTDEIQKLTDEHTKKIDQALAEREKEIMHI